MTRTTLRGSYRAKQRRTQHYSLWKKLNHEREFNKAQGIGFAILVLIGLGSLGAIVLYQSPAFHSYAPGHFNDPTTVFWTSTSANDFNLVNTATGTCGGGGLTNCLVFSPTAIQTAIALSKTTIPDLGVSNGKTLVMMSNWITGSTFNRFDSWGYYLTTNKTLPTQNNYDPSKDINVLFQVKILCDNVGGCPSNATPHTYDTEIFLLRTLGKGDTINIEDTGGCPGSLSGTISSGSSCYLSTVQSLTIGGVTDNTVVTGSFMNYTGVTTAGVCNNTALTGTGCSFITSMKSSSAVASTASQVLPFSNLGTQQLYLGIYALFANNAGSSIDWSLNSVGGCFTNQDGNMCFETQLGPPATQQVQPQIDTGGFFGPIIRALIAIGVFIAQNIISFIGFLYGLIVPLLAGLASIISGFLVTILNAFGNIFGDNHLGTDIQTAFTQISQYFIQVFASAVSIWGNILTTLLNFVTFVTKFFVGNPFIAFLENFISQAPNIWTVLSGVWTDIMKYYISGVFTIQTILVFWYLFGMYEVYVHGLSGFKDWLHTSELGIFGIFKAGYWLINEAYSFVVQLKQLLFGNRISPVTVAANG